MLQTTPVLQPGKVSSSGFILGSAKHGPPSGKTRASQVEHPAERPVKLWDDLSPFSDSVSPPVLSIPLIFSPEQIVTLSSCRSLKIPS